LQIIKSKLSVFKTKIDCPSQHICPIWATLCSAIPRQAIELESCLSPLKMRKVLYGSSDLNKLENFVFVFFVDDVILGESLRIFDRSQRVLGANPARHF